MITYMKYLYPLLFLINTMAVKAQQKEILIIGHGLYAGGQK